MLSRFASHGSLVARASMLESSAAVNFVPARTVMMHAKSPFVSLEDRVKGWEEAHALFNGPERDYKNFPVRTMNEVPPPTRIGGLLPESYFQYIGTKTGVSGPYILPIVVFASLLSKEYIVMEHNLAEIPPFVLAFTLLCKKLGPKMSAKMIAHSKEYDQKIWYEPQAQQKAYFQAHMKAKEKDIWELAGQKHMFQAFHEHVDLQLEAEYRRRVNEVYATVQKKLDYALAIETTKRAFEHKHMANWIVEKAVKSITPQQEKESIAKCIGDLKALAAATKA